LPSASAVSGRRLSSDTGGTVAGAKTALELKPTDGVEVAGVDVDGGDVDGVEVIGGDVVGLVLAAVRWLLEHPHARTAMNQACHRNAQT
jgi:hypothetical protein